MRRKITRRKNGYLALKEKESQIEKAICEYLAYAGYFVTKINVRGYLKGLYKEDANGNKVVIGHYQKDKNPFARKGVADLQVVYRGFHCALEVKSEDGRQSDDQIQYECDLSANGGFYYVVRSIEDAQRAMREFTSYVNNLHLRAEMS